jgi:hypothetical protein
MGGAFIAKGGGLVHVTGFENPPGSRVWVGRVWVWVRVE